MAKKKKGGEAAAQEKLAQDLIPLDTIDGSLMRRSDGATLVAVRIEGVNDSLFTYEQRLEEADRLRDALVSVIHPASIIKVPKSIDANTQLVAIDKEIAKLRREIREEGYGDGHPSHIRLRLLEERLRPKAELEATSGDRVIHPTYIVFEIKKKLDPKMGMRDVRIFVKRAQDMGLTQTHICTHDETVELLQLYFTPRNINPQATRGNMPVMPETRR